MKAFEILKNIYTHPSLIFDKQTLGCLRLALMWMLFFGLGCEKAKEPELMKDGQPTLEGLKYINSYEGMRAANSVSFLEGLKSVRDQYQKDNGNYPSRLEDLVGKTTVFGIKMEKMPVLYIPEHSETTEVVTYDASVCADKYEVNGSKLKDMGKWAYVTDPAAVCYGLVFIDCAHIKKFNNIPWYKY
jgi:hypothetical protein